MKIISRAEARAAGLKRYFTGKPCKNNHLSQRITTNGTCVYCSRVYGKRQRERHPEKIKERLRKYRQENRSSINRTKKKWRAENRDYHNESQKEYHQRKLRSDPDYAERRRKYVREWQREWQKKPEAKCIIMMRGMVGRMLSQQAGERTEEALGYTAKDLRLHIESQFEDWMSWDNHGDWHVDHIIPIAQLVKEGVTDPSIVNALDNLRPLCAKQNMSLGAQYRHQASERSNPTSKQP